MTEHELHGPTFRRITAESLAQDSWNLTELYAHAIRKSPTGEPYFTAEEQQRVDELTAAEEVVTAAEEVVSQAEATMRSTGSAAMAIAGVEPAYV